MDAKDDNARRAWELLFELFDAEKPRMMKLIEEFQMSPIELHVIRTLRNGAVDSMACLVGLHDKSTITRVVERMVKRGLLARTENAEDRRVKCISLTEAGEALRRALMKRTATPPRSFGALCAQDSAELVRILSLALENAERPASEP